MVIKVGLLLIQQAMIFSTFQFDLWSTNSCFTGVNSFAVLFLTIVKLNWHHITTQYLSMSLLNHFRSPKLSSSMLENFDWSLVFPHQNTLHALIVLELLWYCRWVNMTPMSSNYSKMAQ